MASNDHQALLLRVAADAAVRAKWAKDRAARATWRLIEVAYQSAAKSVGEETDPPRT